MDDNREEGITAPEEQNSIEPEESAPAPAFKRGTGENFAAIKKKHFIAAIVTAVAVGAGVALLACGALCLVFKLTETDFNAALYIPVALALFGMAFAAVFLALRPTDLRLAKKLDGKLSLGQKVQTMVEYSSEDGLMYCMQREQADGALAPAAKKRPDFSLLLKLLFIPVLAVAVLFTGILYPSAKSTAPEPYDPPFDLTKTQLVALENLIADVQASHLPESILSPSVAVLEELKSNLESADKGSQMRVYVLSSMAFIDTAVSVENTYLRMGKTLVEEEAAKTFALALSAAANDYKSYGTPRVMTDVVRIEGELEENIKSSLSKWGETFNESFSSVLTSPIGEAALKVSEYADALSGVLDSYETAEKALKNLENLEEPLYLAVRAFQTDLDEFSRNVSGYATTGGYIKDAVGVFENAVPTVAAPLANQSYNLVMDDYIRTTLSRIFNLQIPAMETALKVEGEDEPDDPDKPADGGFGTGEDMFGSNDVIYDPDEDAQIRYKEERVFTKYKGNVEALLNTADPDEVTEYVRLYFFKKLSTYAAENADK